MNLLDALPIAYCVKCHAKRKMKNPTQDILDNGTPIVKGSCLTCGAKMNLFLKRA